MRPRSYSRGLHNIKNYVNVNVVTMHCFTNIGMKLYLVAQMIEVKVRTKVMVRGLGSGLA